MFDKICKYKHFLPNSYHFTSLGVAFNSEWSSFASNWTFRHLIHEEVIDKPVGCPVP